ncbi:YqeB family protein [Solicola gregarius]|uniref:Uncharacterized protein n=1 Tax=Solicola gregarius TaxID=2908642 RepID=A0AA46TKH7_9ACTN|nr:hypothetical protein [Solicola gregarius]UYM06770.1 hypothetical protein L0C25_06770 [Solicola gregarius]
MTARNRHDETSVGCSVGSRVTLAVGAPVLAVLLAWVVPAAADWIHGRPRFAESSTVQRIAAAHDGTTQAIVLTAALMCGAALAAYAIRTALTIHVGHDTVTLSRGRRVESYPRDLIDAVFVEDGRLVLLDTRTRVLADARLTGHVDALPDAFRIHHYPWNDHDPYADELQRWIADGPEIGHADHEVFRARAQALASDDRATARRLRRELDGLGYIVRDEGNRQYWRRMH